MNKLLKQTTSRCPECQLPAPAEVMQRGNEVYLTRTCPEHGASTARISTDARFYHVSQGSSCCAPGSVCCDDSADVPEASAHPFDTLATCLALIEIVDSCNIECPTCFSGSRPDAEMKYLAFEDFRARVEGVIAKKGGIEILQLSGGEPTIHPEFFRLLDWAQAHPNIDYVLINTNGIRLASDAAFAETLNQSYRRGGLQLYLQFDGPQEAGQRTLRGADLRSVRTRAIERAGEFEGGGLPITLAMTVIPENMDQLWATIEYGLQYPHVRGVAFQPRFESGRVPPPSNMAPPIPKPLNTADIILGAVEQSAGRLKIEDFTPLPCGDPNCATIGYLIKTPEGLKSVSDYIDFSQLQGFLADRVNYNLSDLAQCGCDSEPLGDLLKRFELDESHTFRLFIKPFMDVYSWDQDRIDRCCTHVIRPDGELDSFCRYYSGFPDTWAAKASTVTSGSCAGGDCNCA